VPAAVTGAVSGKHLLDPGTAQQAAGKPRVVTVGATTCRSRRGVAPACSARRTFERTAPSDIAPKAIDLGLQEACKLLDKQVSREVRSDEPIMKPLFFNYPADQSTYTINNEWLLGDSLLAAPMLTDQISRDIHLPAGKWYDVNRRRVITGPANLTGYRADLTQVPTFVRLGTPDSGTLMRALASGSPLQSAS